MEKKEKFNYHEMTAESVSENINTVIFVVNPVDGSVEYVFENVSRILGIPPEDFYENSGDRTNEIYDRLMETFRRERPVSRKILELQGFNKAFGQSMWLSLVCSPVTFNTKERYLFSLSDLTEERLIRRALAEAASAAAQASAAKSRFLSNMSHDIRTPMNAIVGFAALAEKNLGDDKKVLDYFKKIYASSNILLGLINEVLDMSRIESGKMVIDESKNSLLEIFEDMEMLVAGQMEEKHLHFNVDIQNIKNPLVYCDSIHLKQILMNLLSNAMKYTPEGGFISLTISQKDCDTDGCGHYEIRVKDTGIGMSREFSYRVFEAFEREINSTVNKIQGTGLGMTITKALVELMGGVIDVETCLGKGTEFIVNLFLRLQEPDCPSGGEDEAGSQGKAAPAPEEKKIDFSGRRILLTDDNELNREIAAEILMDCGFQVETAENGQIALDKLRQSEPGYYDLILMDVQMPVMNGHEATRAIRKLEDSRLASTVIIAMTANAFAEDQQAAMDCGMDGFVTKPIDVEKLTEILEQILKPAQR